jgi:hypothetical protein
MKSNQTFAGALFCALLFSQCSEKAILSEKVDSYSYRNIRPDSVVKEELFSSIEAKSQSFLVDPNLDTVLNCRKGTKVFLPKEVMCFKDGSATSKKVKVIVEECYDAASFLSNNLTTSCGNRLLESGGSVHISASSEGRELLVKDGMDFEIAFPKTPGVEGMDVFYGQENGEGAVVWSEPKEKTEGLNREKRKRDTADVAFNGKPVIPTYTIPVRSNKFLKFKNENGDTIDFRDYFVRNFVPGKGFLEYSKNVAGWQLPICFGLDTVTGKLKDFLIRNSGFPKEARIELLSFLQKLPPISVDIEGPYTGWTENRKRWLSDGVRGKDARYEMNIVLEDSLYRRRLELQRIGFSEQQYAAYAERQDAYNVLFSQQFGWINCDRFFNSDFDLVTYRIPVSSGSGEVRLLFKDSRMAITSWVSNGFATFANIPKGEDVVLIYMNFGTENPEYLFVDGNTARPPSRIEKGKVYLRDNWEYELKAAVSDMASNAIW